MLFKFLYLCRQLRRQEQVAIEELAYSEEGSDSSDSELVPLVEGNDEEAEPPGPRFMHMLDR